MPEDVVSFTLRIEENAVSAASCAGEACPHRVDPEDWTRATDGERLYALVFREHVQELWHKTLARFPAGPTNPLTVCVTFAESGRHLAELPWESMREAGRPFLARRHSFVRAFRESLRGDRDFQSLARALLVTAQPPQLSPIPGAAEHLGRLQTRLRDAGLTVTTEEGATAAALSKRLLQERFDFLYFLGHGALGELGTDGQRWGCLLLEEPGQPCGRIVPALTLAEWIAESGVSLVYLNACHSGATGGESRSTCVAGRGTLDIVVRPRDGGQLPEGFAALSSAARGDFPGGMALAALRSGNVGAVLAHRSQVDQDFALESAAHFAEWMHDGCSLEEALRRVRVQVVDPEADRRWTGLVAYTGYRNCRWTVNEGRGSAGGERADTTATSRPEPQVQAENPYDPWKPAVPPRFVGRGKLLNHLEGALLQGTSVSLVGDARMGKSSLLLALQQRLEHAGRTVRLVSGEDRPGSSAAKFVEAVTGAESAEDSDTAADALRAWALRVGPPGCPPILLVDESDRLVRNFEHRFFERLRGMLGTLLLALASRRELDRLYLNEKQVTSPLFNRLQMHWLGLLEPGEADGLLALGKGVLTAEETRAMSEWAGRHPFFLQLVGHCLVQARRLGESATAAEDRFVSEAGSRLRELWGALSESERRALKDSVSGRPATQRSLRVRGLTTETGQPFGRVLRDWLLEQA